MPRTNASISRKTTSGHTEKNPELNFFFTTIDEQVIQLLSISLIGTDVGASGSLVLEEAGVPGESPCVLAGDRHTL